MPPVHPATRLGLQLVAAHVLGRRRFDVTGRFGLRATPGGFGTPAFGDPMSPEAVRVSGVALVREVGAAATTMAMEGRSMAELAAFAGVELGGGYSCGPDTPKIEDPDAPLHFDVGSADALARWYALGWQVLDGLMAGFDDDAQPATIQLWPEHFDAATTVAVPGADHVDLGFSPGDGFEPEPYAYVSPWGPGRPGDARFWNAPFGAVLRARDVDAAPDRSGRCAEFLAAGLHLLRHGSGT